MSIYHDYHNTVIQVKIFDGLAQYTTPVEVVAEKRGSEWVVILEHLYFIPVGHPFAYGGKARTIIRAINKALAKLETVNAEMRSKNIDRPYPDV